MHPAFTYKKGHLYCEQIRLADLHQKYGSPLYLYSRSCLQDKFAQIQSAFGSFPIEICYAVKANSNQAILHEFAQLGAGADIVSAGELTRAQNAGIPAEKIIFSGVGKSDEELILALEQGIQQINVESLSEITRIGEISTRLQTEIAIAFRTNLDVDAQSHDKISTGRKGDKFGIDAQDLQQAWHHAVSFPKIRPIGLAVHIGSQITQIAPFKQAFHKLHKLAKTLQTQGFQIEHLDFGGGIGVQYAEEAEIPLSDYAGLITHICQDLSCRGSIELGRFLSGDAGLLLCQVLHVKQSHGENFVILDAGMNDLLRPSLYQAHHGILLCSETSPDCPHQSYQIVGPVCETGDCFHKSYLLPSNIKAGDLLAFETAGAYGAVMGSTYNSRPLCPEIFIHQDQEFLIRPRQTIDDLIRLDRLPDWH